MQFSCCVDPVHKHHTMKIKFLTFLTLALNRKSSSTDACVLWFAECNKSKIDGTRSICWWVQRIICNLVERINFALIYKTEQYVQDKIIFISSYIITWIKCKICHFISGEIHIFILCYVESGSWVPVRQFLDWPQDDLASARWNIHPKVQMESAIAHVIVQ
jgi:hypothetical protein